MACICQKVPAKSAYTSISKANVKSHFLNSLLPGNVIATTKSQEVAAPGPETVSHVTPPPQLQVVIFTRCLLWGFTKRDIMC